MFKRMLSIILVVCLMGALLLDAAAISAFAASTYTTGQYIISEKLGLNIRTGPGTGYKKIGAVSYNTVVEVVAVNGDWGKISSSNGGKSGWICLNYAKKVSNTSTYTNGQYIISEKLGLNIRTGPGTGYKKIGAVSYNTVVEVVAVNGDWGKISSSNGGKSGWICLKFATKQSEENGSGSATRVMPDSSIYSLTGVVYTIDGAAYRQAKLTKDLGTSTSTSAGTLFWLDMENYIVTDPGTLDKLMDLVLINEIRPNLVSILEGWQSAATGYYDVFTAWTQIGSFGNVMGTSLGVAVGVAATGGINLADVGIEVLGTVADPQNVAASAYLAMIRVYSTNVFNCAEEGIKALRQPITSYEQAEYAMNVYALVNANQAALEYLAGEEVREIANCEWYDFTAHCLWELIVGFAGAVVPDITAAQMAWYIANGSASLLDFGMSTGVLEVYEDAYTKNSARYLGRNYPAIHQAAEDLVDAVMNQNPYVSYGLQNKVNALMQKYAPGSRQHWFESAKAWDCHGFACEALMLFWNTGKPTPTNSLYTYYKATASKSYVDKIRPGDMVRYRIGNYDHTIVVTNVDDEYVYYADSNADLKCTIVYNKRMSKTELANLLAKKLIDQAVSTRGYICHYRYNNL